MDFFNLDVKGTNVISPTDAPKVVTESPYNEHAISLRDDGVGSNDLFRNSDVNHNLETPIETNYFNNRTAKQTVQPIAPTFPYQPHPRRSQILQFIDFDDDNSEQHNVLQHTGHLSSSELGPATAFHTSFSHSQLDTFTSNAASFEGALSPNFLDYDFDSSSFTANRKGVVRNQSVGSGLVSSDSQSKLTDYLSSPTAVNSSKAQFGVISRPSSAMSSHAPPSGYTSNTSINIYSVGQRPPIPSPRAYSADQDADSRPNISQSLLDHNSYHSQSIPPSQRPQISQQQMQGQKLSVEDIVTNSCREILTDAADHALKAVELANTLRARIGTEMLAQIRERWGGLLALLERYQTLFRVDRIPKNDKVTLICSIGINQLPSNSTAHYQAPAIGAQPHSTPVTWSTHRGPSPRPIPTPGAINMRSSSRQSGTSSVSGYSLSPSPDSAAATDVASYFSSMFHSQDGDTQHSEHGSGYLSSQQASRCLHVGNVPLNITEVQLMREFEKFGQLDGLKLINQRSGGRRFAFITFYTIEQAITAKHCLSKIHPWKSAISFAHRDFNNHSNSTKGHHFHPQAQHSHSAQYSQHPRAHTLTPTPSLGKDESGVYLSQLPQGSWSSDSGNGLTGNPFVSSDFPALGVESAKGVATPPVETRSGRSPHTNQSHDECDVLRRLCDDTYVPTQPWPTNCERDKPYCFAVIAQLQQFGGCTTVSKLRGFLRNRIAASDNIKSVPLKAMLAAYPHFFIVQNNYVSLQPGLVSTTELSSSSATSGN